MSSDTSFSLQASSSPTNLRNTDRSQECLFHEVFLRWILRLLWQIADEKEVPESHISGIQDTINKNNFIYFAKQTAFAKLPDEICFIKMCRKNFLCFQSKTWRKLQIYQYIAVLSSILWKIKFFQPYLDEIQISMDFRKKRWKYACRNGIRCA